MKYLMIFLNKIKKNRRITKLISICIILTLFSSCFSYLDINKAIFVTAIIIDTNDNDEIVIYLEAFKPFRGTDKNSEKGERIIFKGTGKTAFEALRDINLTSSFKINYTQNKAVIYTEKIAEKGIDKVIDFFNRDQEMLLRPNVYMFLGKAEELINVKLKEEEYIGLFLADLIHNQGSSSRTVIMDMNSFLNNRLQPTHTAVVTTIIYKKLLNEDKLEVSGGAVFKNDRLVSILEKNEGQGYNFLNNAVKSGTLEVDNPDSEGNFVSLEIRKSQTSTNLQYINGQVLLKKKIKVRTTIGEVQVRLNMNDNTIRALSINSEENIKKYCYEIFEKYKNEGIDVFNIQNEFERKYPNLKLDNVIKITNLQLEVEEKIEGSSDVTSFY